MGREYITDQYSLTEAQISLLDVKFEGDWWDSFEMIVEKYDTETNELAGYIRLFDYQLEWLIEKIKEFQEKAKRRFGPEPSVTEDE